MRRDEDDLPAEHQAGAARARAAAAAHAAGLQLGPAPRPRQAGRSLSRPPSQDRVRGEAGAVLGHRRGLIHVPARQALFENVKNVLVEVLLCFKDLS